MRRIHFRKYINFARRKNKKVLRLSISVYLIIKSFQIFDDSVVFSPNNITIQKNAFLLIIWKQPQKGVWKTHRKTTLPESILNSSNFSSQSFPCNFSKSFQKTSNCCIVIELNQICSSLKRETGRKKQTHQETVFSYKWLLQHNICNISIAKYMNSLPECFRSESNSEPLRWNIRWIFLRKLLTATARQLFSLKSPSQMFHWVWIPLCR